MFYGPFFNNYNLSIERISETEIRISYLDQDNNEYVGVISRKLSEVEELRNQIKALQEKLSVEQRIGNEEELDSE